MRPVFLINRCNYARPATLKAHERRQVIHQLRCIPFLVIGGGLGGLATALALSRKGYPVHVLEKAHEFGEIGAGIQIAPNGSRALDELGVLGETCSQE